MNASTHDFEVPVEGAEISEAQGSWLDRYSIKQKVHGAILGATFFLWLISLVLMAGNLYFAEEGQKVRSNQVVDLGMVQTNLHLTQSESSLGNYIYSGDATYLTQGVEAFEEADKHFSAALDTDADLPNELRNRALLLKEEMNTIGTQIADLSTGSGDGAGVGETRAAMQDVSGRLMALSHDITIISEEQTEGLFGQISQAAIILGFLVLFAPLLAIWIGRRVAHDVSSKIEAVTHAASELSKGKTDTPVPGRGRDDEIGALARALTVFRDTSRREVAQHQDLIAKQQQIEEEREAARQASADAMRRVSGEFNQQVGGSVDTMASAAEKLMSTADTLANAAEDAIKEVSQSAESMDESAIGVTAAAAASDEFALSISEISKQATQSADLAREAGDLAKEANHTIDELSREAEAIEEIVVLIQSIATRTNLLALNASIEAARGGEQGKGFAVVASEVKELAARTARATSEISHKVAAIQGSTNQSVSSLKSVMDQIERLETSSIAIASSVDQQSATGHELARHIDLAARSTERVRDSLKRVETAAKGTENATSEIRRATTGLDEQLAALRESADTFRARIEKDAA